MENLITNRSPEANMLIRHKIAAGENVYLKNLLNGVVIRITRYNDFVWAKSKDGREYRILYSSNLMNETFEKAEEITKAEYDNY
jgi:hypothetical protein